MLNSTELPTPSLEQQELSQSVLAIISAEIEAHGPVSLDRFWEIAQYTPGLGYYSNGLRRFGPSGDFVTAPELGDLFARCLARPLVQVIEHMPNCNVLELGAGSGALAADLLLELERLDALPQRYLILDRSGQLRQQQHQTVAEKCPHLLSKVEWLDQPLQDPWCGVILANEVVDALPARRFARGPDGWQHLCVDHGKGCLNWRALPADERDLLYLHALERWYGPFAAAGYTTEYQPQLKAWLAAISESLSQGAILLIDYGYSGSEYYHEQRHQGTLICHYRHRAHDNPLLWPGLQDISVSVDFSHLNQAAQAAGLDCYGWVQQAHFLFDCGLAEMAEQAFAKSDWPQRSSEIKQLTLPAAMGERFKVFAALRGLDLTLTGFGHGNAVDRL